jgi:hypothetical protein
MWVRPGLTHIQTYCARWPAARRAVCGRGRAWASRRRGGSPGRVRCSRPARRACRRRRRGCSGPGPGAFRGGPTRGARAAAAHGGRWASRGCGGSPGRVRRSRPADPAPVRLALRTPVCPCCVRAVLVRFVVGVCVLGPLPAARARAVLGLCAFVLGVWCACIAFVYIVRPSPVNVVNITAVRGLCGVLVRFVVGVCVLRPLPAARARAVCPRAVRAATARCDLCW